MARNHEKEEDHSEIFVIYYKWFSCFFNCEQHLYYILLCVLFYVRKKVKQLIFVVFSLNICSMKCDRFFRCIQHILS